MVTTITEIRFPEIVDETALTCNCSIHDNYIAINEAATPVKKSD